LTHIFRLAAAATWDGGKTWNTGGIYREVFEAINITLMSLKARHP